jgi:hypothetical protein
MCLSDRLWNLEKLDHVINRDQPCSADLLPLGPTESIAYTCIVNISSRSALHFPLEDV